MFANTDSAVAFLLWHAMLCELQAAHVPANDMGDDARALPAAELLEEPERVGAVYGSHVEGIARAGLLNFLLVRDGASDPDEAATRAELLQQYADSAAALLALQDATGTQPDSDDAGMVINASASELNGWADDLSARCGLETAGFASALRPLCETAFKRDSAAAFAVCQGVLTAAQRDAWRVDDADPRGEVDGGADMYRENDEAGRIIGLYRAPQHHGGGWYVYDGRNDGEIDCTQAGGALDVDAARVALRECVAAVESSE